MNRAELERVISSGESEILEFKRSTGQLTRGCETLCGFLNASGGQVLFGVTSEGRIIGQKVADKTLQSMANELKQFEPPPTVEIEQIPLDDADGNEAIIPEFMDQKQVHGHAFHLLEEAMLFLGRHLPVAGRIVPGVLERQDEPLFPLEALREALVNALCHRNYSHPGGSMSVAIYDDRLEIWNDGPLPFGLTPEDLKRDHLLWVGDWE